MNTPDGKWLRARILGLSYYDTESGRSVPMFNISSAPGASKIITLNFTDISMQGYRQSFFDYGTVCNLPKITLKDCQLRGVKFEIAAALNDTPSVVADATLQNNLWERCAVTLYNGCVVYSQGGPPVLFQNPLPASLYNNLFWKSTVTLSYMDDQASNHPNWAIRDNLFDSATVSFSGSGAYASYLGKGYNARYNTTMPGSLADATDVAMNSLVYANGPQGNRYIDLTATDPILTDEGSRAATDAQLSGHTIQVDQVPEGCTTVDIGFHYRGSTIRAGFDQNSFYGNDDDSLGPLTLPFAVNFFGTPYSAIYVNENGNVTFNDGFDGATYGPLSWDPFQSLTEAAVQNNLDIIAPFWADVDTRRVCSVLVTYGSESVDGRSAFGVNWVGVGYYSRRLDKRNSFQIIFIDRSDRATGDYDVEFNFEQIQWESGDASGGTLGLGGDPARVGFADADGSYFEMTGSGQTLQLLDSNPTSGLIHESFNSCFPGRYVFQFHNGAPLGTP